MIHSSNRPTCIGRIGVVVIAFALVQVIAGGAFAVTHNISSLPYTCSTSNDTLTVTADLSSTGTALTVGGSGIRNIYIKGAGHTITFNTGNTDGVIGIAINRPQFITIENLTLIQSGTALSNRGINVGEGDSTFLNTVSVHVKGDDSKNVYSDGTRDLRISYGNYTSYVTNGTRRDLFSAAAIMLDDAYGNNNDWSDPSTWRYWIRHITIDSCPHAGMYLRGGRIIADSNNITVDAQSDYTYPSGNMYYGVANAYAIIADRDAKDSRIIGNTLRSGTNHLGGRGILIENSQDGRFTGTAGYTPVGDGIEIAYNNINVHAGPDPYYGGSYQSVGLRIRNDFGFDSVYVHHNTIFVEADTATATNHTGPKAAGMWFSGPGGQTSCVGWRIEYNNVTAQGKPGLYARVASSGDPDNYGSYARALIFDQDLNDGSNNTRHNRFISNVVPITFGDVNSWGVTSGEQWTLSADTIVRSTPSFADNFNNNGAVVLNLYGGDALDNDIVDPVFQGDTSVVLAAGGSGPAELTARRTVHLTVLDKNGLPVQGATVGLRDARGIYQVNGITDANGKLVDTVTFRYYHWGVGSDTAYNPFVQFAKFGADSVGESKSFGLSTNGNDTLLLSGSIGHLDTIPPGMVGDLSVAPADVAGHFTFGWTSTGDDGATGTASYDSVRFSTSPLSAPTWASATRVPRTVSPKASGVADQIDVSETAPVPGQFYYVGIMAYDEVGSASPLAVDSGFARGILTPQIAADLTNMDTVGRHMTFYSSTVRSYLSPYYEFQSDSASGFPAPTILQGTVQSGHATATFNMPTTYSTVYVRCRAVAGDHSQNSAWSTTRAFSITGGAVNVPPDVPVAVNPISGDTVTSLTVALTVVNSVDLDQDPVTYQFELYDANGTTRLAASPAVSEGVTSTSWTVPAGIIQDRATYRWTARVYDGQNYSDWMNKVRFTVLKLSSDVGLPSGVARAYPNPVSFGDGSEATFVLGDQPTDLTIMTVSGDIILRRENVSGDYRWNGLNQSGERVSVGLYLWFLSNGSEGKLMVKPN